MRLSVLTLDDGTFELSLDLSTQELSEEDDESCRRAVARDVVKDAITHAIAIASNPSAQWPPKPPASPRSRGASRGISGGLSRGLSREGLLSRAALSSRGLSSRLSSAPPSRRARRDELSAASQAFEEARRLNRSLNSSRVLCLALSTQLQVLGFVLHALVALDPL